MKSDRRLKTAAAVIVPLAVILVIAAAVLLFLNKKPAPDVSGSENGSLTEDAGSFSIPAVSQADEATDAGTTADKPTAEKTTAQQAVRIFSRLPREFYFTSGAGGWATDIWLEDDGSFTGYYHDHNAVGDSYECSFDGRFAVPEKVDDYIYSTRLESLDVKGTPGDVRYADDTTYVTVADAYGLDNPGEFLIYMPYCPLTKVAPEFLTWVRIDPEIKSAMPEGVYGIYNVGGQEGFMGRDDDSVWFSTYTYTYNGCKSELYPSYSSRSSLIFWPESGAAELSLSFAWNEVHQGRFTATDNNGTGDYDLLLDFSENMEIVNVKVTSLSGYSLEPWGGTADGTLSAAYELERR